MRKLVLDTNVVLDLFVFDDPRSQPLKARLLAADVQWLATRAMREELERVLAYSNVAARLVALRADAPQVLAWFDRHAQLVDAPPPAPVNCTDGDDQMFIDLAVHHQCVLLSKDLAVLALKQRLAPWQVDVDSVLPPGDS